MNSLCVTGISLFYGKKAVYHILKKSQNISTRTTKNNGILMKASKATIAYQTILVGYRSISKERKN